MCNSTLSIHYTTVKKRMLTHFHITFSVNEEVIMKYNICHQDQQIIFRWTIQKEYHTRTQRVISGCVSEVMSCIHPDGCNIFGEAPICDPFQKLTFLSMYMLSIWNMVHIQKTVWRIWFKWECFIIHFHLHREKEKSFNIGWYQLWHRAHFC